MGPNLKRVRAQAGGLTVTAHFLLDLYLGVREAAPLIIVLTDSITCNRCKPI